MNRIDTLFQEQKHSILSIYFTAGYPTLDATPEILQHLQTQNVDMVEIGIPFSDPLADGVVIQESSTKALQNGMSIKDLFLQLQTIRKHVSMPLLLMGYFNPVLQFGVENFCKHCSAIGIDGVIIPDLPIDVYLQDYRVYFEANNLHFIFLITPQTSDERIRVIDNISKGFIYMVSSTATTGTQATITMQQIAYFKRVQGLQLKNPLMIGFGISNKATFTSACQYANGGIIGSAFVAALSQKERLATCIQNFVKRIR